MQVSVSEKSGLERHMHVQVPAAEVDSEVESRLRSYGARAKIKGFRPGKIPFKVIKQRFGGEIRRQVLGEIMQSSFSEAVSQEKLLPAGGPRIEPGNIEEGADLEYTAIFEVYPEITPAGLDKLKLDKSVAEIKEADVDRVINNLREQRADWQAVERASVTGDRVTVDFEGRRDGEAVDGASGTDVPVELGGGQMLPDFEAGLTGIKTGEQRDFNVKFPEDYHASDLAGAELVFSATAKVVEERVLPEVDDAFCEAYGVAEGGVERLRADVRANMERELGQTVRTDLKRQVMEQLLELNDVPIPAALVEEEIGRLQKDASSRLNIADPDKLPPRQVFEEQARRRIALGLLINEIVSREKIELDPALVDQRLQALSYDYQDPEQVVRAYRSNPQLMQGVESAVLEDQVVDWLIGQAKVKEKKTTFAKIMNLD